MCGHCGREGEVGAALSDRRWFDFQSYIQYKALARQMPVDHRPPEGLLRCHLFLPMYVHQMDMVGRFLSWAHVQVHGCLVAFRPLRSPKSAGIQVSQHTAERAASRQCVSKSAGHFSRALGCGVGMKCQFLTIFLHHPRTVQTTRGPSGTEGAIFLVSCLVLPLIGRGYWQRLATLLKLPMRVSACCVAYFLHKSDNDNHFCRA